MFLKGQYIPNRIFPNPNFLKRFEKEKKLEGFLEPYPEPKKGNLYCTFLPLNSSL